jgi:hypothetical protein
MHAYGFRFSGLNDPPSGPESWPEIRVRFRHGAERDAESEADRIDGDRAALTLEGGTRLELDRAAREATYTHESPQPPPPDEVAHPLLATAGAIFARWLGREVYHAAGVVVNGRAWAIEGQPGDGKSTLAAALAALGHAVLTDDTLVVDGRTAFAGPRCIDLRAESLSLLDMDGLNVVPCRAGTRQRVILPPVMPTVELGGWVFLEWSDTLEVVPMGVHALPWVTIRRTFPVLPSREQHLLDLSGLPAYWLKRQDGTPPLDAAERLMEVIEAAPVG